MSLDGLMQKSHGFQVRLGPAASVEPHRRRPIHVLTLTPFYPFAGDNGYGCFVSEPIAHFENVHVRSSVIALRPIYRRPVSPHPSVPEATWLRYLQIPSNIGLPSSGLFLFPQLLCHVVRIHKENKIDLIHAHGALPCGYAAMLIYKSMKIPFAVSAHGLDVFTTRQAKGLSGYWCKKFSSSVYRSARRVICVSERVQQEILKEIGNSVKTTVVYNGVDTALFSPVAEEERARRFIILSVGNLISVKGHDTVLRALPEIIVKYPMLRYEIIGDGPERPRLKALSEELKISKWVHFLGRQSRGEVANAMKRCMVFALPSEYEALGCVYLEAMATAKPVIACRGQGIEEIVRHGENAWLIGTGNVDAMREALSRLLEDAGIRERLGKEGRQTVIEGLTWEHQADRLRNVYTECMEENWKPKIEKQTR